MDLALNNLQRLTCHNNQTTNNLLTDLAYFLNDVVISSINIKYIFMNYTHLYHLGFKSY